MNCNNIPALKILSISNCSNESEQHNDSAVVLNKTYCKKDKPVDVELLKSYVGIKTKVNKDFVSEDEFLDFIKKQGIVREDCYEKVLKALADKNGKISFETYNILKSFQSKKHKFGDSIKLFETAKLNDSMNYKALYLVDQIMNDPIKFRYFKGHDCCLEILKGLKNAQGNFDENAIDFCLKHIDKLKQILELNSKSIFNALKNNEGEFSHSAICFADQQLASGNSIKNILSELFDSKDANGNFSSEMSDISSDLKGVFSQDKYNLVKIIANSFSKEKHEECKHFIEFAKSINDEENFNEILSCIFKLKENKVLGLDYNEDSLNLVKELFYASYKNIEIVETLLNELGIPYKELSQDDLNVLKDFLCNVEKEDMNSYINAAKWKAGSKKDKFDINLLSKYLDIYKQNRLIFNAKDVDYLSGCFALEEDDRAISLFQKLYTVSWQDKYGNEEKIDKSGLNFILGMLCKEKDGVATRKCYPPVLDKLSKLLEMKLPMYSKEIFETFMYYGEIELVERLEKVDFEELGIKPEQVVNGIFKVVTEEELLKFKKYLKDYLKDKDVEKTSIKLNPNISSIVEVYTSDGNNKTTFLYDFKKGTTIAELKENRSANKIIRIQKDFQNNSISKQKFIIENDSNVDDYYENLLEQTFEKYDKNGNFLFSEVIQKSDIKNIFNVKRVYADGREVNICNAYKNIYGNTVVEKNMESFDGTKTKYRYEDDPQGNRIIDYKITDKKGKVLMNQSVSFEVVDLNHFISTRNNKKFDIHFYKDNIVIKNLENNEIKNIKLKNFTRNTQEKVLKILKQLPGEELFAMKKLDLKAFCFDENIENASFYPNETAILFSDKFLDLGVALHEWGHAKDIMAFKQINEEISNDKKLRKIYEEEKEAFRANFSEAQLSHIGYFAADYHYLGKDKAIKEGIAETNTILSIIPQNESQSIRSQYWQQYFPRTIAYLSNLLN